MPTLEERVAALEARVEANAMSGTDLRGTWPASGSDERAVRTWTIGSWSSGQMNRRFEQVDRRFEQVDRRFEMIDRRFEQVDHRFAELQGQMNQRFDAVDQKIDRHFTWLVGIQVAVLVAVVGALVGSYYR